MLHESHAALQRAPRAPGLTESLETLAAGGEPAHRRVLIGAAGAARDAAGGTRQPDEDAWVQRIVADLRAALGERRAGGGGAAWPEPDAHRRRHAGD